jgi:internalin A
MRTANAAFGCLFPLLIGCDVSKPAPATVAASAPPPAQANAPVASAPAPSAAPPSTASPIKMVKKRLASECKNGPSSVDFGDDEALEREVRRKVGKDAGAITPADLTSIKSINLVNAQIAQVDPCIFPMMTSLKDLFFGSGEYDDLTPIRKLTSLTSLRISFSTVKDLKPIEGLKRLDRLDLSHTLVGDEDLKPVGSLVNLTELMLDEDSISDLAPLSGLKKLERLSIKKTQVKSLAAISGLSTLKFLYVADTPLTDITPVQPLIASGMKLIQK